MVIIDVETDRDGIINMELSGFSHCMTDRSNGEKTRVIMKNSDVFTINEEREHFIARVREALANA